MWLKFQQTGHNLCASRTKVSYNWTGPNSPIQNTWAQCSKRQSSPKSQKAQHRNHHHFFWNWRINYAPTIVILGEVLHIIHMSDNSERVWILLIFWKLKTYCWKRCTKIIFKCMDSAMGPKNTLVCTFLCFWLGREQCRRA